MSPSPSPPPVSSNPPSPSPASFSPSRSFRPSTAQVPIHTYHCLCSTVLLATPYLLSSLPTRAPPAKDQARILPLPRFRNHSDPDEDGGGDDRRNEPETARIDADADADADADDVPIAGRKSSVEPDLQSAPRTEQGYFPSLLLPALRPARKITLVQREDGYERRRVWRCGRCGVGIGYEVENAQTVKIKDGGKEDEERVRVMFILENGLVQTENMFGGAAQAAEEGKTGVGRN